MEVFIAFAILIALTAKNDRRLAALLAKSRADWLLDSIGLFFQGILIPILQITVVYKIYSYLLPSLRGYWDWHPVIGFSLSFVLVDYLYYWNHRLLHGNWLWPLHRVHHTMTDRDVVGTSRNSLWTSFLIIYLWINALFIYLLQDPTWYIAGVSLTSALDLWRHSEIDLEIPWLHRLLSPVLILPQDHAWHHAKTESDRQNYGANLKLWDCLHGTYYESDRSPEDLGIQTNLTLFQKLVWPF